MTMTKINIIYKKYNINIKNKKDKIKTQNKFQIII